MNAPISVLLPVENAQHGLRKRLSHILDVISDLCENFELIVVDQGSRDDTAEEAVEISRDYPQLRVVQLERPCPPKLLPLRVRTAGKRVFVLGQELGCVSLERLQQQLRGLAEQVQEMVVQQEADALRLSLICRRRRARSRSAVSS